LYEGLLEGLLTFLIVWTFTSKPRPRWVPSGLFLSLYAIFRIAIEFVRVPDAQLGYLAWGWLTMGIVLSVPMLVFGVGMMAYGVIRRQPSGNTSAVRVN